MVDSLEYEQLTKQDQSLIDSVLKLYHENSNADKNQLINVIVETTWDNRVWPKYNKLVMENLKSKKKLSGLDSAASIIYAGCLINHGYYLRILGKIEKALEFYHKSYDEYLKFDNKEGLAFCLNNMGVLYDNLGNLPKALESYHYSLRLQEEIGEREGEANSLSNIGEVHKVLGDLDKSLDFFNKALKIQKEIENKRGEAMTLVKIADVFVEQKKFVKAEETFKNALLINQEIENGYGEASVLKELGKLAYLNGDFKISIAYLKRSLPMLERFQDIEEVAKNNGLLAQAYLQIDSIILAKFYSEKCLAVGKELEFIELISSSSLTLSKVYEKLGDITSSHQMLKTHIMLKDSMRSEGNKRLTIRMQVQHDYEKQKALDDKEREKKIALAEEKEYRQKIISISFAVIILLVIIFLVIIIKRLRITREQKMIIAETNEELNQINEEILAQRDEIEEQKNLVEAKNHEITSSIEYAKRIQEAILPTDSLFKNHLPESFVLYQPKAVVAGDFYWMEVVNQKVFFAAADCTGHGVPGAMVSVVCHGALNRSLREYKLSKPADILDKTRELVLQTFDQSEHQVKDGMDICLCVWDKTEKTLEFAGANNPLYLLKGSEIEIIKGDKQPIGYSYSQKPFTNHNVNLSDVGSIFLFTDGFPDQFGGNQGKKLGYSKFRYELIKTTSLSVEDQKNSLEAFFKDWRNMEEQVDDVCVIGVRI